MSILKALLEELTTLDGTNAAVVNRGTLIHEYELLICWLLPSRTARQSIKPLNRRSTCSASMMMHCSVV